MKIYEILDNNSVLEQQLDELSFKHAIAAGAAAGSLMGIPKHHENQVTTPTHTATTQTVQQQVKPIQTPDDVVTAKPQAQYMHDLTKQIMSKYSIDPQLAKQVVRYAFKYQKTDFPTAQDILAIIGVESAFDPNAQSELENDPALGLMQVRPGVWNLDPSELTSVENQIKIGADILHKYYKYLKNEEDAVKAYNIGLKNFLNGNKTDSASRYLSKFKNKLASYSDEV